MYIEDDYVLVEQEPMTQERVQETIDKLCDGKRSDKWYEEFIDTYTKYSKDYAIAQLKEFQKQNPLEIPKGATPDEEESLKLRWKDKVDKYREKLVDQMSRLSWVFENFKPNQPVSIPGDIEEGRNVANIKDYKTLQS